jgi:type IV pilus assembly protein PilB
VTAPRRFGELLVERGFISAEQLREALRVQGHEKKRLGQVLLEMGALSVDQLNWALSELVGVPYVELTDEMVDLDLVRTLPEEILRRHQAVPVLRVAEEMTVILADPTDRQALRDLEVLSGTRIRPALASQGTIAKLLDKAFPPGPVARERVRYAEVPPAPAAAGVDGAGIAQVYSLLLGAFREGADEVHLEPWPQDIRVRYRVGGRLVDRPRLPRGELSTVLFRFRILAGLRGESLPTTARVRTRLEGQEADLDLLFFPTLYGEAVTIAIWRRTVDTPTLEALDLPAADRRALEALVARNGAGGLVVVTGWEARARTALMYALAQAAAVAGGKALTIERAVSFVIPEFVQVEMPDQLETGAPVVLGQPVDVALVEDVGTLSTALAAFAAAEHGAVVVGGMGVATNGTALSQLLALDVPRIAFLETTRGLVNVRRRGGRYGVEVLPLTDELRRHVTRPADGHR